MASDVATLNALVGDTAVSAQISNAIASKVDIVDGKVLSSNDYTDEEKTKLAGIATGANNYTLPTASSTLGGVKTTSTVTSNSGYTACPIISGVPYYKDTNTTYTLSSFGVTATAAELNYVDGVTSNVQTQLDAKAASSHNHSASNITSGTLPITRGGTGATTAAGIRTNLGITDYIVAQGTSGIWTYRKWNSGIAECWGNSTISYQIDCTTQRANAVYTDDTFKGTNASLPSGLFTSVSFATANARTNGYTIAQVSFLSTTTLSYRMWCPYSTLLASGTVVEFHVKGKWK